MTGECIGIIGRERCFKAAALPYLVNDISIYEQRFHFSAFPGEFARGAEGRGGTGPRRGGGRVPRIIKESRN